MKIFLTSYSGGFGRINGIAVACEFNRANGFYSLLKKNLPIVIKCLIFSADPYPYEGRYNHNDNMKNNLKEGFLLDGFNVDRIDICDNRNAHIISKYINDYNLIFLAGGHVPTQNEFFNKIELKKALSNFKGVIIGRSAGAMNCADIVYAQPELDGEAVNPEYKRYLSGLGLTDISILPHFEIIRDQTLDGLNITNDISLSDSKVRPFYALTNKSFIYIDDNCSTLFGEGYFFKDGVFSKICDDEMNIDIY